MPHVPDDRKLWCGNIPPTISMGELQEIMLEIFRVEVRVLAKGRIDERRDWAIIAFDSAIAAQSFQNAYDGQQIPELHVP